MKATELRCLLFGSSKSQHTLREFRHMSQVLQNELPLEIFSSILFLCWVLSGRLLPEKSCKLSDMKTKQLSELIVKLSKCEQQYETVLLPYIQELI